MCRFFHLSFVLFFILQITKAELLNNYYDLVAPCTVEKTGQVGVIKDIRHCNSLLEESEKGEIIPRVCNYEICKDFVCCPLNPNRLNQICSQHDDPRYELHYKALNQLKCTVEKTGAIGIFTFAYTCNTETLQKTCDYEKCRDIVCCPLERITSYHGYDQDFELTEVVGDRCHEETTNSEGVCRFQNQCLQSDNKNYTLCGRDHCSKIVCCPEPDVNTLRLSNRNCANYKKFIYNRVKPLTRLESFSVPNQLRCFRASSTRGQEVLPNEFPQMAALGYKKENDEIAWNCGATIISDLYVLTSANCLFDKTYGHVKYVRLGVLNVEDRFQACPEDFLIETTIPHPNFTNEHIYNDIALIGLNRKINFNSFMVPACLPQSEFMPTENYKLEAIGWNLTLNRQKTHLLKIQLQFYNKTECNKFYGFNETFRHELDEDSQICAGSRDTIPDNCPGDYGGPLLASHSDYYRMRTILGINSAGKSCGSIDSPGIYTNVWPYVTWIENIVWKN